MTYTITVKAEGNGAPTIIRVRRALKWLLRAHGLRCTDIREAEPTHNPDSASNAPQGQTGPLAGIHCERMQTSHVGNGCQSMATVDIGGEVDPLVNTDRNVRNVDSTVCTSRSESNATMPPPHALSLVNTERNDAKRSAPPGVGFVLLDAGDAEPLGMIHLSERKLKEKGARQVADFPGVVAEQAAASDCLGLIRMATRQRVVAHDVSHSATDSDRQNHEWAAAMPGKSDCRCSRGGHFGPDKRADRDVCPVESV